MVAIAAAACSVFTPLIWNLLSHPIAVLAAIYAALLWLTLGLRLLRWAVHSDPIR